MVLSRRLRLIKQADCSALRDVYADAIRSQGECFYTTDQIQAWASLAFMPGVLDQPLLEGQGWLILENNEIEAFALRHPSHRLALLYCRGRSARRGYATALIDRVEFEARQEGQIYLVTEASAFSYSLFLRCGWEEIAPEHIQIGGVSFERYRMKKYL